MTVAIARYGIQQNGLALGSVVILDPVTTN